jgi:biofilm PGA synthesis N-glycosyltransferase PgaC
MLILSIYVFWVSLGLLALGYIFYPLLMAMAARLFPKKTESKSYHPHITLLIPCHNEAKAIRKKLIDSLKLDWEKDKLEILVISDSSDDRTDEIAKTFAKKGVRLIRLPRRSGKMAALFAGAKKAAGEILVFTDANTTVEKEALQELVKPFADSAVGGVAGEQIITGQEGSSPGEGIYWKYESFIKRAESRTGNICGADGSLYAVRRKLFIAEDPRWMVMDDLLVSLWVVIKGKRLVYCPTARAFEEGAGSLFKEFRRKARILAGSIGSMRLLGGLWLKPIAGKLLCHKLLRWISPFLLLLLLASDIYIQSTSPSLTYEIALFCQVVFYAVALVGILVELSPMPQGRLTYLALYFLLTNLAQLWGFVGLLTGRYKPYWRKER